MKKCLYCSKLILLKEKQVHLITKENDEIVEEEEKVDLKEAELISEITTDEVETDTTSEKPVEKISEDLLSAKDLEEEILSLIF